METVPCNLCGADDASPVFEGRDLAYGADGTFRLVKCGRCGLVYVNPRPTLEELPAYYPQDYQALVRDAPVRERQGVEKIGANLIFRRRMPPFVTGGRALEIGCGSGWYLAFLRNLGWQVQGVEVAPALAAYARDELKIDVRTGAAETALAAFPDDSFDVVAMWHVLEHLSDPSGVLSQIHRILKPGGRLMVELPNFRCVSRPLLGSYWFYLELPRHLYQFAPDTLDAMLRKARFAVAGLKGVPAALAATASLQLMWNQFSGNRGGTALVRNPALLTGLFPISALLAAGRLSANLAAEAIKPEEGARAAAAN